MLFGLPLIPSPSHALDFVSKILITTAVGFDYPRPMNSHVAMVGPLTQTVNSDVSSNPHWIRQKWYVPTYSLGKNSRHIYVNLNRLSGRSAHVILLGIEKARRALQSYARRVCDAVAGAPNVFDAQSMRSMEDECMELTLLSGFFVYWFERSADRISIVPSSMQRSFVTVIQSTDEQQDFLNISEMNVVAAVSHCPLPMVQEALLLGIPALCLPTTFDQRDAAARILDFGCGRSLHVGEAGQEAVALAVMETVLGEQPVDDPDVYLQGIAHALEARAEPPPGRFFFYGTYHTNAEVAGRHLAAAGGARLAASLVENALLQADRLRSFDEESHVRSRYETAYEGSGLDVFTLFVAIVFLTASSLLLLLRFLHIFFHYALQKLNKKFS
mmetsp:Transcript_40494/g.79237  ORF Transcript_40494/g.79237 Transcript_40494/m.79237 type:complete len:386 (+) Transcript_40494:15-1172(+)